MDRLDSMSIFLAVIEAGSLSAAARTLGKPLTTVSRKISDLEAHLNARLLVRSSRKLELTETGRHFSAACKKILGDLQEAEQAATGEYSDPKGELVLTAPLVFGRLHVLPVVTEFLKAYPDIDIQLVLADRVLHLLDDHVDLAVRIGKLPDSNQIATKIGEVRLVICGSPGYFSIQGKPAEPAELTSHTCITFENINAAERWTFRGMQHQEVSGLRSRLIVNTAEAAIDAAISGLGITRLLSYQIQSARAAGTLETVLESYEPEPFDVHLIYAGRGLLPLKLRVFLDFAKPRLKNALLRVHSATHVSTN